MSAPSTRTVPEVGVDQAHDHRDGGGLAGAVAAEQAGDRAGRQRERNAVDRGPALVDLDELVDGDGRRRRSGSWAHEAATFDGEAAPPTQEAAVSCGRCAWRVRVAGTMPATPASSRQAPHVRSVPVRLRRSVRLDTLVRLRWLAVFGQTVAVLVVHYGLDFELPIWACLAVIALYAWLNVAAAGPLSRQPAAGAGSRRLAARLRHRRARRAPVPHRRAGESVRVPVPRAGADLGDRAAARA